jgi:hypothetical protein
VAADAAWKPLGGQSPVGRILALLFATVGLPYFLLSSTSPLVQSWFARDFPGSSPYRLFALSNFASMLRCWATVPLRAVVRKPRPVLLVVGGLCRLRHRLRGARLALPRASALTVEYGQLAAVAEEPRPAPRQVAFGWHWPRWAR